MSGCGFMFLCDWGGDGNPNKWTKETMGDTSWVNMDNGQYDPAPPGDTHTCSDLCDGGGGGKCGVMRTHTCPVLQVSGGVR